MYCLFQKFARYMLPFYFFAWVMTGCRGAVSTSPLQPVPPTIEPVSNGKTAQPATSGLTGLVYSASDVSGQPDTPLPGQALVAIPEAEAAPILGLNNLVNDDQLRFLKSTLGAAGPQMSVTVSNGQGNYSLALLPGTYILCVGEENVAGAVSFPLRTRGCGRVVVPQEGVKSLDISSGFGEILLVEP